MLETESAEGIRVAVETEVVLEVGRCWREGMTPPAADDVDASDLLWSVELDDRDDWTGVPLAAPFPAVDVDEAALLFWTGVPFAALD